MHKNQTRIVYLDGLRGLAILLVIVWHLYGPGAAEFLPFANQFGSLPIVRDGWAGVQLFFLISGFVIFMTLERCSGFIDFMTRRWRRLFPAMLVATVLIGLFYSFVNLPMPDDGPVLLNSIPGLTFISPNIIHAITRLDTRSLDGVFWSLYVEVSFYAVFSVLFFKFGWRRAIVALVILSVIARFAPLAADQMGAPGLAKRAVAPFEWLGCKWFGFFAAGALLAKSSESSSQKLFAASVAVTIFSIILHFGLSERLMMSNFLMVSALSAIFFLCHASETLRILFSARWLLFAGSISYPFYLLHNNIGIALANVVARALPSLPAVLIPLPGLMLLALLAWVIARYVEPVMAKRLRHVTDRIVPQPRAAV